MLKRAPVLPDPEAPGLARRVDGTDRTGAAAEISMMEERPLTIFLDAREIVTAMTIGGYPEYPALGFLLRQVRLTLIGRMRGQRFVGPSGGERLVYDIDPGTVPGEDRKHQRKGAADE